MSLIEKNIAQKLIFKLEIENDLMKFLLDAKSFYELYLEVLEKIKIPKTTFEYCQSLSISSIKICYYDSFEDFEERFLSKVNPGANESKNVLLAQKNFLLLHFKEIGFTTWESFSPLVLHYYPVIGALRLKAFYNGTSLDKEVIRLVDCVRQIIA